MSTTVESLKAALAHRRAGRLDEAERIGRQILEAEPQNTHALQLLGALAHDRGRHAAAADYLTRATMFDASEPAVHSSLAAV
jgi:predicted Zn-dependent protease